MPQIVFPEFRDATENTKYPFIDSASLTDNSNKLTLPTNIFIDANIYMPGVSSMVYISSIIVEDDKTTITVRSASDNVECTGTIKSIDSTLDSDYIIPLYSSAYKVGALVIASDKLSYFKSLSKDTYKFAETATAFVPSCVTMMPTLGITSIAVNERKEANTVYGDVWIVGWRGVTIRTQENIENSIRIDVMGDPLFTQAAYPDTPYEIPMPIMTINGLEPDEYGNFNITVTSASDSLRINTTEKGLYIYMAGANGN